MLQDDPAVVKASVPDNLQSAFFVFLLIISFIVKVLKRFVYIIMAQEQATHLLMLPLLFWRLECCLKLTTNLLNVTCMYPFPTRVILYLVISGLIAAIILVPLM